MVCKYGKYNLEELKNTQDSKLIIDPMIKFLKNKDLDKTKWDDCIKSSVNGLEYAQSWYLDIVADDWDALVEDDYQRVMPLITRMKYKINYLFQPVFTQQLGVFSQSILSQEIVTNFINSIPQEFKFAEINLNSLNKIDEKQFRVTPFLNHELDLIHSYEYISSNYSTNLKRNLKKAAKSNLQLQKNIKPEEIISMFRENRGKEIELLQDGEYQKLQRLAYSGIYKGLIQTFGAYTSHNELCAGAIFMKSGKKVIFLFSGVSEEGRRSSALPFIIDFFIRENVQKHITLDFEGSNNTNLARFYKSFGSKECTYPHLEFNHLPIHLKLMVHLVKWLRKV